MGRVQKSVNLSASPLLPPATYPVAGTIPISNVFVSFFVVPSDRSLGLKQGEFLFLVSLPNQIKSNRSPIPNQIKSPLDPQIQIGLPSPHHPRTTRPEVACSILSAKHLVPLLKVKPPSHIPHTPSAKFFCPRLSAPYFSLSRRTDILHHHVCQSRCRKG